MGLKALLTQVMLAALTLALAEAAAGQEACFTRGAACLSAPELAASGIAAVRFQPLGLGRVPPAPGASGRTSWKLFAYRVGGSPVPQTIEAHWPAFVHGEDGVMALQETLCAALVAGGVACTSDFFDGTYVSTGVAPFELALSNETRTDLSAAGTFTTRHWSCRKSDGNTAVEVALACSGTYTTSRRLLYLTGTTNLTLMDVTCGELGSRPVTPTASERLCPEGDDYPAAAWLPTGGASLSLRANGPSQLFATDGLFSLRRRP